MHIFLTGGGTLGPVTPLFALIEAWQTRDVTVSFSLIGTPGGPERHMAETYGVPFFSLVSVRLPRYRSWEWLLIPFRLIVAIVQSVRLVLVLRPDRIVGAGGYTQVPLIITGWFFRIPCLILQTDIDPLLANQLVIPFVDRIIVGWEQTKQAFPPSKTIHLGVPVRRSLRDGSKARAVELFHLDVHQSTLLVLGGGTGSVWLNESFAEIADQLAGVYNVVHLVGKGKRLARLEQLGANYVQLEQVEHELKDLYAAADVVVSRAGLGTISELVFLSKPCILIPLPKSVQEHNARLLERAHAARVLQQKQTTSSALFAEIQLLMQDVQERQYYSKMISTVLRTEVADQVIDEILKRKRHID